MTTTGVERSGDGDGRVSPLAAISDEMVRLYKEKFGRGPQRVRTHWCSDDLLVTTLEDTFTPVERTLAEMGEHQRIRDIRMVFQYASSREFCEPVERITGRTVKAFISGIDTEADGLAVETFVFHPRASGAPSRSVRAEP